MKTKSAYRAKILERDRDVIQAEPELKAEPEAKAEAPASEEKPTAEEYAKKVVQADAAAERLRKMIADLQQPVPMQPQMPVTRAARLDAWRQQGMSADQAEFLKSHPAMIDYPDLTAHAAREAEQAGPTGCQQWP